MTVHPTELEVWLKVVRQEPDKAGPFSDWLEDHGEAEAAGYVRRQIAEVNGWLSENYLRDKYFSAYSRARIHAEFLFRCPPAELLGWFVPELNVARQDGVVVEGVTLVPRPGRGTTHFPATWVVQCEWGDERGERHPWSGIRVKREMVYLPMRPFGGLAEWGDERCEWRGVVWAGRSSTGLLYCTELPSLDEVTFRVSKIPHKYGGRHA